MRFSFNQFTSKIRFSSLYSVVGQFVIPMHSLRSVQAADESDSDASFLSMTKQTDPLSLIHLPERVRSLIPMQAAGTEINLIFKS